MKYTIFKYNIKIYNTDIYKIYSLYIYIYIYIYVYIYIYIYIYIYRYPTSIRCLLCHRGIGFRYFQGLLFKDFYNLVKINIL